MSEMELFISESTKEEVENIMMKKVKNAFHWVNLGANPHGIYSACPPDEMNCIEERVIKHVMSVVGKYYLTSQHRMNLDHHAKQLHQYFRQSSKVNFPRCSFPNGVSDLSNMKSHEHVGLCFMLIIIFSIDESQSYFKDVWDSGDLFLRVLNTFEMIRVSWKLEYKESAVLAAMRKSEKKNQEK